ncbi:MAG: EAL domain-containing protein [Betaproteobacteria bacterium]|nr:EAL domain-containing protein [Betaproteobacteria bacterium]
MTHLNNNTKRVTAHFSGLSLRAELALGFALVIVLALVAGAVSLVSQERSVAAVGKLVGIDGKVADLSFRSVAAMLNARRAEKDFLIFRRELGFVEAKARYATLVRLNGADIRQHMAGIRDLVADPGVIDQTRTIERILDRYEAGFLKVVELYGQLGRVGAGIEGRMRRAAHEIEPIVRNHRSERLLVDLLTLRREEKDFIARGLEKHVDGFEAAMERFKVDLFQAGLPPDSKKRLKGLADVYLALFREYVRIDARIDTESTAYLGAARTIEPEIEKLHLHADHAAEATRDSVLTAARATNWTIMGMTAAAALLGLGVALFLSRGINRSVAECVDFAQRVSRGELATRITPRRQREFLTLASALNRMAQSLQDSRSSLEQRAAELAELNAELRREVAERRLAEQQIARLNKLLAALSETNETIIRVKHRDELFRAVCRTCVEQGGMQIAYIGLIDATRRRVVPVADHGPAQPFLGGIRIPLDESIPEGRGPIAVAIREHRPYICNDILADPATLPWRDRAQKIASRATAAFPLYESGRPIGILSLHAGEAEYFDPPMVKVLVEMAADISFALDNLERERLRRQVEEQLRLRNRAVESTVNAILITDFTKPDNPIEYVNPAFVRITGFPAAEVLGRNCSFLQGNDRNQPGIEDIRAALRERRDGHAVLRNYRKDGSLFWNDLYVAPVADDTGRVTHYVGILNDVTETKNYERQLERQANYDALTGLANRNLLRDRLQQGLAYAQRHDHMVAVAFIDLDHFKVINDSLGHGAGDELLKVIGGRLKSCIRSSDTVARLGGDEFVVLLSDLSITEIVPRVITRIIEAVSAHPRIIETVQRILGVVSRPIFVAGREFNTTCSIGVALYPQDGENPDALLKNADAAMYRAKELGRNNFQFYTAELNARMGERLSLQAGLRHALERQEFFLVYQPKLDLRTGAISGLEALVRWNSPELGPVPPSKFIPVLEETGMIIEVGRWVMEKAVSDYARWSAMGLRPPRTAVNVSAIQLKQRDFAAMVAQVAQKRMDGHPGLDLEITESLIMASIEDTTRKLREIREAGVGIAIDDFGTGYSSLSYLARLPVDALKIDRAFIANCADNPDDLTIVSTIISLAHALNLSVVAEGVETEEQKNLLTLLKCDEMQGYLFSHPLPAAEVETLLVRMQKQTPPRTG